MVGILCKFLCGLVLWPSSSPASLGGRGSKWVYDNAVMSGHNKWAQIKHKKQSTDAAKSRVFARYARLIALESKKVGGSLSAPGLASAIARAKAMNMPKDNIEWAFTRHPNGSYVPNPPLMDLSEADEEKLGIILDALDEHEDVQRAYTNARGYERTDE